MLDKMKRALRDTLTRGRIESGVRHFAESYCATEDKVYDIGGGRYSYKKYFKNYLTVNLDPSEGPDVRGDAEDLPLRSNSLDAVLCIALLEHVGNPEKVLDEIYRTLKPGGSAYVWVPFYWREHRYPMDHQRYTADGLSHLLKKAGFTVKEITREPYSGFFFLAAHDIRFLVRDPHKPNALNPLLYLHALACILSRADKPLNLRHPTLYTGVEAIIQKPTGGKQNG